MVDANNIVGAPITTPDGVTLIPISRVSFGFGSGGGDYGKQGKDNFGGGGGAGVKIDPVAFLVIKDGTTRVMPVAVPPVSTVDRIVDTKGISAFGVMMLASAVFLCSSCYTDVV